ERRKRGGGDAGLVRVGAGREGRLRHALQHRAGGPQPGRGGRRGGNPAGARETARGLYAELGRPEDPGGVERVAPEVRPGPPARLPPGPRVAVPDARARPLRGGGRHGRVRGERPESGARERELTMGKPTGFLEFRREAAVSRRPEERVKDWDEWHSPVPEATLRRQGARCMDCGTPFCHTGKLIGGMASAGAASGRRRPFASTRRTTSPSSQAASVPLRARGLAPSV